MEHGNLLKLQDSENNCFYTKSCEVRQRVDKNMFFVRDFTLVFLACFNLDRAGETTVEIWEVKTILTTREQNQNFWKKITFPFKIKVSE